MHSPALAEAVSQPSSSAIFFLVLTLFDCLCAAVNLLLKPTAGVLASVTLPIEGGVRSIRGMRYQGAGKLRRLVRYHQGITEAEGRNQAELDFVTSAFRNFQMRSKGKQKAK